MGLFLYTEMTFPTSYIEVVLFNGQKIWFMDSFSLFHLEQMIYNSI